MGIVVDITPRLILAAKLRGMLKEMQFTALHRARKAVEATEHEITLQQIVIWDPKATQARVEEAIYALPLLHDMLDKRKKVLSDLQLEFFGADQARPAG